MTVKSHFFLESHSYLVIKKMVVKNMSVVCHAHHVLHDPVGDINHLYLYDTLKGRDATY